MLLGVWAHAKRSLHSYCLYNDERSCNNYNRLWTDAAKVDDALYQRTLTMKCSIHGCPGEYERRLIVHTVKRDARVIVVDDVPAGVCTVCSDTLLAPETVRRLQAIIDGQSEPDRLAPLYFYGKAGAAV